MCGQAIPPHGTVYRDPEQPGIVFCCYGCWRDWQDEQVEGDVDDEG